MNQIGLVSLACDKPLVMADYRKDRELGAFILIDRLTNQTAALGVIEPAAPTAAEFNIAPAVEPSFLARIATRMDDSDIALSVVLSSGVYVLTGNQWAAGAVLTTDVVLRPLMAELRSRARAHVERGLDDGNESGAGI